MKLRTLSLASAVLLTMTLLSAGIVSATNPARHNDKLHAAACVATAPATTVTPTPTPTPTPTLTLSSTRALGATGVKVASFHAMVISRNRCGTIVVVAAVRHGVRGTAFSASAVAHFASGDVTVQLSQAGKWLVATGRIPVPTGQAAGKVKVDISIVYGGAAQPVITKIARIRVPKPAP